MARTLAELLDEATNSAAGRLSQPRPVPYRNATAPRPLPRTMRPADVRANDPQLAQSERDIARRELQRGDTLGRLADMGAAQSAPDPIHTPLQSNVIAGSRMVLPGAYDAGNAAGRIARGEDAWGDLALNTGMAALPFLGARGMRGEPAPAPMREPLPPQAWSAFGDLPPAEAPRPNGPQGPFHRQFAIGNQQYRASIGPMDDGGGNVTFDLIGNPRGAFSATGGHSVAEARDVFRNVERAIRDDIAQNGRPYYELYGVPEKMAVYRQLAARSELPPGYAWDHSDPEALVLRRAPAEAPRPNAPPPQAASGTNASSDAPSRFQILEHPFEGARGYRIPLGDGRNAVLGINRNNSVSWGFEGDTPSRSLPVRERARDGLRAMRGVVEALKYDAEHYSPNAYGFTGHPDLYRQIARQAEGFGYQASEPREGVFHLNRQSRNASTVAPTSDTGTRSSDRLPPQMYHGTDSDFAEFRGPAYFADTENNARDFGRRLISAPTAGLNIKIVPESNSDFWREMASLSYHPERIAEYQRQGYDGVRWGGQTLVFEPNRLATADGSLASRQSPDANAARPVQASDGNAASGGHLATLRAQGFNVDEPLYHGSNRDLSGGFQASDDAELNGVWLAPDPNDASFYATVNGSEGANVTPVFTRGRIVDFNSPEIADWRRRLDDWRFGPRPEGTTWPEPPPGVAGVRGNNLGRAYWEPPIEGGSEEVVVFDPANIRSRFAPPPPDRTPKSLPRRKPPNGGFSMFGAPR